MSESLYICAASLCCCLVVCALVRMIAPEGNTSKIISLIIGVFSLCCLVSPFVTLAKDFDVTVYESDLNAQNSELSRIYDEEVLKATGDYVNSYIQALLMSSEINPLDIKTTLSVNESKGIYIKEVNIYINKNSSYKKDDIYKLIETALGIKPKITER